MKIRQLFAAACAVSFIGTSTVQAAPPTTIQEAIDQVQADSVLLGGWLNDQFSKAIPFNSTAGNVVPSQFKVLGFDVGAAVVVTGTETNEDAFHALGTSLIDTTQIDTFDRLPLPMILGHAKIGLPWGLDAGLRLGGIPSTDSDEGDTHVSISNSVFGLDLRKILIEEGMTHPFGLTLGLDYTHAKGHVEASTPYDPTSASGVTLQDAIGNARTNWDTHSVGLSALMNKKILFMNPYIGAAVNKNFGDMDSSIRNSGTVTEVNNTPVAPQSYSTIGLASKTVNEWDFRGMLGLEITFLPFMKLGIGGEIASQDNLAAHLGLRVQFR